MPDNTLMTHPAQGEKEVHLSDYLHVVQRRWKIAMLICVLAFAVVAIKTSLETSVYEASVILRVSLKPDLSQEVLGKRKERYFSIDSEIHVLKSYAVAERAAKIIQLDWRLRAQENANKLYIHRLNVPDEFDALNLQIVDAKNFRLLSPSGVLLVTAQSGIPFQSDQVSGLIELHKNLSGTSFQIIRLSADEAIGLVNQGVNAAPVGDQVSMLRLSVQRTDPKMARDVANAIASAYQELAREQKVREAGNILELIDQQLAALGRQLNVSEQNLQQFKIQTGLQRLSPEGSSMVDAAVMLEKQRADLLLRKDKLEEFRKTPGHSAHESSVASSLPGVPEMMARLLELRGMRSELLREYTPSYPAVIEVEDKIGNLRQEIAAAVDLAIKSLNEELTIIDKELALSAKKLEQVPEEELELARLTRSSAVNAELYSYLLQRQQEERNAQAAITSNIEIISKALLPKEPVKPNKPKNLGMGLLLGLFLGVGMAFLLEYFDQTLKDEEDVQSKLGLVVLGTIPRIVSAIDSDKRQLVTHLEPHSIPAEAFLALRTNIHFILTNQKHKTLMLTSCLPDEGKSTIAVNLASTMAQTGAKTLLVGCDLRRPSLFSALDQDDVPGLSDLLVDGQKNALRRIDKLNLDFIPGGTEPPNPTQILSSQAMKNFLEAAKQKYDFVILDVPPLIPVADALILSSWVDLNVLVIEPCRVPERMAKRALQLLHNHEATIAGVVLNDKSGKGARYYGGYGYYNEKYYNGYYKQNGSATVMPAWKRVMHKVWSFING